jgi:hypothetical protein
LLSASDNLVKRLLPDFACFSSERAARAAEVAQEITEQRPTNAILLSQRAASEHADAADKCQADGQRVKEGVAAVEAIRIILVELLHSLLSRTLGCGQRWVVVIHRKIQQHEWQHVQQSPFCTRRPKGRTLVKPKLQAWAAARQDAGGWTVAADKSAARPATCRRNPHLLCAAVSQLRKLFGRQLYELLILIRHRSWRARHCLFASVHGRRSELTWQSLPVASGRGPNPIFARRAGP